MPRDRIGIVLGVTGAQELAIAMAARLQHPIWRKAMRDSGLEEGQIDDVVDRIRKSFPEWTEASFPGLLGNVVAGRVANRLDLHGPNCVTDAACASALAAVSMAISDLQLGRADVVITGGVDTMNDVFMYVCFSKTPALSPHRRLPPLLQGRRRHHARRGTRHVRAEAPARRRARRRPRLRRDPRPGRRLRRARQERVRAAAPRARRARCAAPTTDAGYSPATVELLEAHGTGTVAGDAAEFAGLCSVFDAAGREDRQWCALGSVKSQIGHTKAAAAPRGCSRR